MQPSSLYAGMTTRFFTIREWLHHEIGVLLFYLYRRKLLPT